MANTDIIVVLIGMVKDMFTYMLPIIGFMAGVVFITSFLYDVTLNAFKRTRH